MLVWYENCFSYLNKESFWSLFTLLVKSHIEYEATVWNQTQIYLINTIENVHRRTSKLVPEMSGLTHGENDLPTLFHHCYNESFSQTITQPMQRWSLRKSSRNRQFTINNVPCKKPVSRSSFKCLVTQTSKKIPPDMLRMSHQ